MVALIEVRVRRISTAQWVLYVLYGLIVLWIVVSAVSDDQPVVLVFAAVFVVGAAFLAWFGARAKRRLREFESQIDAHSDGRGFPAKG